MTEPLLIHFLNRSPWIFPSHPLGSLSAGLRLVSSRAFDDFIRNPLYILIVMSFYAVFLCGIMLGYVRSKRREKRRTNVFTRLVHEEEQREWGALPKKHSLTFPAAVSELRAVQLSLPFCGNHGNQGHLHCGGAPPSPLACALACAEQSSVSSLCSSADTRFAIEEESDSGAAEGARGGTGLVDDSG